MSKPTARAKPARGGDARGADHAAGRAPRAAPIGPRKRAASVSPPDDCMKRSRDPGSARCSAATWRAQERRQVGVDHGRLARAPADPARARSRARPPRARSRARARARRARASCSGVRVAWISAIATDSMPCARAPRERRARGARHRAARAARRPPPTRPRTSSTARVQRRAACGCAARTARAAPACRSRAGRRGRGWRRAASARRAARAARWSRPWCRARSAQAGSGAPARSRRCARAARARRRPASVVRRQQLRDVERAVRRAADHVGEGAAAIDPELPGARASRAQLRRSRAPRRDARTRASATPSASVAAR